MRAEASEVKAKGNRTRFLGGARRRPARGEARGRLAVEMLEVRDLMATLPAGTFPTGTVPISATSGPRPH